MLRNWRHLPEKRFSLLVLQLWVAFQWPFFMVRIFNIFPFLPSCFILECYSSGAPGPEEARAVVCLSLAPRPAGWGESVCIYILSPRRAPCGANKGCLGCAAGKQIPGPPASPGDVRVSANCRRIVKSEVCLLCLNPHFWNNFSVPILGPVFTSFQTRWLCCVLLMKTCF